MLSFLEVSHVTVLTKPPHFRLSEAFRWCRRSAPAGEDHLASDPLNEIFLLVLCAVISGSGGWTSIALHGEKKLEFLRRRAFCRSGTERHAMISWAMISWGCCFPIWIWRGSNAVS